MSRDERRHILELLELGEINAAEASRRLIALNPSEESSTEGEPPAMDGRPPSLDR